MGFRGTATATLIAIAVDLVFTVLRPTWAPPGGLQWTHDGGNQDSMRSTKPHTCDVRFDGPGMARFTGTCYFPGEGVIGYEGTRDA